MVEVQLLAQPPGAPVVGRHEIAVGVGLFHRLQVLPQAILDELHGAKLPLGQRLVAHDAGQFLEAGLAGGPPSPLAGQDHISRLGIVPADRDRLDLPSLPERVGEFGQALRVELLPGLSRVGLDQVQRDHLRVPHPVHAPELRGHE